MAHPPLSSLLAPGAKTRNLDLGALLAVSGQEGASGGIGDGGHAFGPFQLNNAGGVITGKFPGWTPERINAWAWSPAGINYALDGIARVAGGKHGAQAVASIVRDFERPQDPGGETSRALASYGGASPAAPSLAAPRQPMSVGAQPPSAAAPAGNSLLASIISSTNQNFGLGGSPTLASLLTGSSAPQSAPAPKPLVPAAQSTPTKGFTTVGGVQVDPTIAGQVQQIIGRFGVHPTSGYRSADHNAAVGGAPHSDHLSGDAVDFGGTPGQLKALYTWAQGRVPYVEPWSQTGGTHDHISFRR